MANICFKQTLTVPIWAERQADRAIPYLAVPRLVDLPDVADLVAVARQRRLALLFVTRVALALGLFGVGLERGWYLLLLPATWTIYGGALTAVHHLIHGPLGMSEPWQRRLRSVLAAVVTESGHALEATHLVHHRTEADAPDPEGYIEHVPWRNMPLEAFRFRYRLMWWGLRHASPERRRIVRVEVAAHVVIHVGAVLLLPITWWPAAYVSCIALASAAFAVMAGKGPQTNWGRPVASPLVRITARATGRMLFSHDRHLEHHAYPQVPLPWLRRLDAALEPTFAALPIMSVRLP